MAMYDQSRMLAHADRRARRAREEADSLRDRLDAAVSDPGHAQVLLEIAGWDRHPPCGPLRGLYDKLVILASEGRAVPAPGPAAHELREFADLARLIAADPVGGAPREPTTWNEWADWADRLADAYEGTV